MACYSPMIACQMEKGQKVKFLSSAAKSFYYYNRPISKENLMLPCKQCIGCRLEYSRQWAIRITHEASLYDSNLFLTLTYRNEELPSDGSLVMRHMQLFLKKLRYYYPGIRYFYCGEYGEKFRRPHYHLIVFNMDIENKVYWKTVMGNKYYKSNELNDIWQKGFVHVGSVSFESAAYVARYATKKINGRMKTEHYISDEYYDLETGEMRSIVPEFAQMSRMPGIGYDFYKKWRSDMYPRDVCIVRGFKCKPPKYYDRILEKEDVEMFNRVKAQRLLDRQDKPDLLYSHLQSQELHTRQRMKRLMRAIEVNV